MDAEAFGQGFSTYGGEAFLNSFGATHGQNWANRIFPGPGTDFETPWGKGPYWNALTIPDLQKRQFRATVEAARENKVHPLFALGSSANFSPAISEQPRGSRPGGAGGIGPGPLRPGKLSALQQRVLAAQAENDEAQAMYWRSKAAKEAQSPGGAPDASIDAGAGVIVKPPGASSSLPQNRPLVEQPRESAPMFSELKNRQGETVRVLSQTSQADELNQVLIAAQGEWIAAKNIAKAAGLDFVWNAGRQAYELVRRARRPTSQAEIHRKGRASMGYRPAVPLP